MSARIIGLLLAAALAAVAVLNAAAVIANHGWPWPAVGVVAGGVWLVLSKFQSLTIGRVDR